MIKNLKKSNFLINVFKLFSGTATGQIIAIILSPILYRLYNPESFGVFSVFIGLTTVLGTFSTFQFLQLILLEKKEETAINFLWVCRLINIGFTLIILISIIFFSPLYELFISNKFLSRWLWLIPLLIFLNGQNEIFCIWANRNKDYNTLVWNGIINAAVTPIASIGLSFILNNEAGLFFGLLFGRISSLLILLFKIKRNYDLGFKKFNYLKAREIIVKNKKFPIFLIPSEIINRLINELPVFVMNNFFGAVSVGYYSLSKKILEIPLRFIGNAVGSVFKQKASQDFNESGSCKKSFLKTSWILFLISSLPVIIIGFLAPTIFGFIFGEKWIQAGVFAQLLIPMVFLKLIVSPVSYVFYIYKKLKEDFIMHIYMLISSWIILYFFFSNGMLLKGIFSFSINYSFVYIYMWFRSYYFTLNK